MVSDETWKRLEEKYGVDGYTDSIVYIKLESLLELDSKLEAIKKQIVEPQLKDSKEYLDTHPKPEPHNIEMSRYWLEKGIYGTVSEIMEILRTSCQTAIGEKDV